MGAKRSWNNSMSTYVGWVHWDFSTGPRVGSPYEWSRFLALYGMPAVAVRPATEEEITQEVAQRAAEDLRIAQLEAGQG